MKKRMEMTQLLVVFLFVFFSQVTFSQPTCTNIVRNAGFENGLDGNWTVLEKSDTGTVTVLSDSGSNVLLLDNIDGSSIGVVQVIQLDEYVDDLMYAKYRVKSEVFGTVPKTCLQSLDIVVDYDNGEGGVFIGDLKVVLEDEGVGWIEKERMISPERPYDRIVVNVLNYHSVGTAYFDDIFLCRLPKKDYVFENEIAKLTLTNGGVLSSLSYVLPSSSSTTPIEHEQLKYKEAMSKIHFLDGTTSVVYSVNERSDSGLGEGEGVFDMAFFQSSCIMTIQIKAEKQFFTFELLDLRSCPNVKSLELLKLWPSKKKELDTFTDTDLMISTLPMDDRITCAWASYQCKYFEYFGQKFGWSTKFAIVAAPQQSFWVAHERFIDTFSDILPKTTVRGEWFRLKPLRDSYFFARTKKDTVDEILDLAKRGKFPELLLPNPLILGSYNTPRSVGGWESTEEFVSDMKKFTDNGIDLGIHTFSCRVDPEDPLFSTDVILKFNVSALSSPIDDLVDLIPLSDDINSNAEYIFYTASDEGYSDLRYFLIDEEIVLCRVSASGLFDCERGKHGTVAIFHAINTLIHWLPFPDDSSSFVIDHENPQAMEASTAGLASLVHQMKVNYIYIDGHVYYNPRETYGEVQYRLSYIHNVCWNRYLEKFNHSVYTQFAGGVPSWAFYTTCRKASADGVCFREKNHTLLSLIWCWVRILMKLHMLNTGGGGMSIFALFTTCNAQSAWTW